MTSKQNKDCSAGKFKRLNYYHGMLLTEQDFQAEQYYFREKMKLHNRLHGYGVVWGLELMSRCTKIDNKPVYKFFIEPGFALDCDGNEIIVCHPYMVPVDEKLDQIADRCEPLTPCAKLFIAIKYCECKSEPQPQYACECGEEDPQPQFSRIHEGFNVQVLFEDEIPECCKKKKEDDHHDKHKQDDCCKKYKQACPGLAACCEEEHVIILGCICIPSTGDEGEHRPYSESEEGEEEPIKRIKTGNDRIGRLLVAKRTDRNFHDKYIDPDCKPPRVCKPCPSPRDTWEQHRQKLMHDAYIKSGKIDISEAIGKPVDDAERYLKEEGADSIHVKCIDDYDHNLKEFHRLIEKADCYMVKGQSVWLITDQDRQNVLFAFCKEHG